MSITTYTYVNGELVSVSRTEENIATSTDLVRQSETRGASGNRPEQDASPTRITYTYDQEDSLNPAKAIKNRTACIYDAVGMLTTVIYDLKRRL